MTWPWTNLHNFLFKILKRRNDVYFSKPLSNPLYIWNNFVILTKFEDEYFTYFCLNQIEFGKAICFVLPVYYLKTLVKKFKITINSFQIETNRRLTQESHILKLLNYSNSFLMFPHYFFVHIFYTVRLNFFIFLYILSNLLPTDLTHVWQKQIILWSEIVRYCLCMVQANYVRCVILTLTSFLPYLYDRYYFY